MILHVVTAFAFCTTHFLSIVLSFSVCVVVYFWGIAPYSRRSLAVKVGRLPGPTPLPFIGHLLDVIRHKGQVHLQFGEYYKNYGRVYSMLFFGKTPCVVVNDAEMVKDILVKEFHAFHDRPVSIQLPEPFRSMVTVAKGTTWERLRSTLSPSFTTYKMKLMIPLMNASCDVLISKLEDVANTGKPFDLHSFSKGLTMETILKTAFGIQSDAQLKYEDPEVKAARDAMEFSTSRSIVQLLVAALPFREHIVKAYPGIFTGSLQSLVKLTEQIIQLKKQSRNSKAKDLLDVMVNAAVDDNNDKRMTEAELLSQTLVFLFAGYQTTNNTLSFACHCIATHPDVQEKLQQEIDGVWTNEEAILSYDAINQMPYLDMVLKEAQRLYPVGLRISRECVQDCVIKGLRFAKGVVVVIDVFNMQRDPGYWPDPDRFDPDRFKPEAVQNRNPYTYLPFSHGPRNCIGRRFAQMAIKTAMARILKRFTLVATPKTRIPPAMNAGAVLTCGKMILGIKHRETNTR